MTQKRTFYILPVYKVQGKTKRIYNDTIFLFGNFQTILVVWEPLIQRAGNWGPRRWGDLACSLDSYLCFSCMNSTASAIWAKRFHQYLIIRAILGLPNLKLFRLSLQIHSIYIPQTAGEIAFISVSQHFCLFFPWKFS